VIGWRGARHWRAWVGVGVAAAFGCEHARQATAGGCRKSLASMMAIPAATAKPGRSPDMTGWSGDGGRKGACELQDLQLAPMPARPFPIVHSSLEG